MIYKSGYFPNKSSGLLIRTLNFLAHPGRQVQQVDHIIWRVGVDFFWPWRIYTVFLWNAAALEESSRATKREWQTLCSKKMKTLWRCKKRGNSEALYENKNSEALHQKWNPQVLLEIRKSLVLAEGGKLCGFVIKWDIIWRCAKGWNSNVL